MQEGRIQAKPARDYCRFRNLHSTAPMTNTIRGRPVVAYSGTCTALYMLADHVRSDVHAAYKRCNSAMAMRLLYESTFSPTDDTVHRFRILPILISLTVQVHRSSASARVLYCNKGQHGHFWGGTWRVLSANL